VKAFLLLAVVVFFVVTIVMAVVFRDRRAKGRLRFVAKVGWAYVIAIVALAAWRLYSDGW
jgi:multisubunit Na+/H+ antiporter MnhB subunit